MKLSQLKKVRDLREVKYAPTGEIERVVICGGESKVIGLADFISSSLDLPAEQGNPLVNVSVGRRAKKILGEDITGESLPYATAIGLAIRGAQ